MHVSQTYTIILTPAEEGGFVVQVPSLPEVCTQGDTEAEALANAREAIALAISVRVDEGEPVPVEREPQVRKVTIDIPATSAA